MPLREDPGTTLIESLKLAALIGLTMKRGTGTKTPTASLGNSTPKWMKAYERNGRIAAVGTVREVESYVH
jgi:hypothetical protein